jgi:hypothetical protein
LHRSRSAVYIDETELTAMPASAASARIRAPSYCSGSPTSSIAS